MLSRNYKLTTHYTDAKEIYNNLLITSYHI